MDLYWLLIPYITLVPINGVRLFLLQQSLDRLVVNNLPRAHVAKLHRLKAINLPWYIWLLREVKDWALIGVLAGVSGGLLSDPLPWLVPSGLAALGLVLFNTTCIAIVILLYSAGYRVPEILVSIAVRLSIPDYVPANRKRTGSWGVVLLFSGVAGLATWYLTGNSGPLLWSFVTITLGFLSFLRALYPAAVETSEVNFNA